MQGCSACGKTEKEIRRALKGHAKRDDREKIEKLEQGGLLMEVKGRISIEGEAS